MESVVDKNKSKVDEAAINATMKMEMDKINDSLSKINQMLNVIIYFSI
jgi:hypothetical protein